MTWHKVRRSSFRRIQRYEHNYCLLTLTGCLGCRWKRYKQSKQPETVCDYIWSGILFVTFLMSSLFLFYWLAAANDQYNFNNVIFSLVHYWLDWYWIIRSLAIAVFTYVCWLVFLCWIHAGIGYQLYIHYVHRVLLLLLLLFLIVVWSLLIQVGHEFWALFAISLKVFGPYIQLFFVLLFTILSWLVAHKTWHTESTALRATLLCLSVCVMAITYLSPLMASFPCICARSQIPAKPKLAAHRGASAVAPENTMAAFDRALQYNPSMVELDVALTADGKLFTFHDVNLQRTTNVAKAFPNNVTSPFWEFKSEEIEQLNAGEWFLRLDPFSSAGSLPSTYTDMYRHQAIPALETVLSRIAQHNVSVVFDVVPTFQALPIDHPYRDKFRQTIIDDIHKSGISLKKVMWLEHFNHSLPLPLGMTSMVAAESSAHSPPNELKDWSVRNVNTQYGTLSEQQLRAYRHHHIDVYVHLVDSSWLLSYFWCIGVHAVYTSNIHLFSAIKQPLYTMEPRDYLVLWILADCVSAAAITVIFIFQYFRRTTGRFIPEVTMPMRMRRGQMKEKLLYVVDRPSPELGGIDHQMGGGDGGVCTPINTNLCSIV